VIRGRLLFELAKIKTLNHDTLAVKHNTAPEFSLLFFMDEQKEIKIKTDILNTLRYQMKELKLPDDALRMIASEIYEVILKYLTK